jgi:hypothetical protein
MERKCPECGNRFSGRADKKYCSEQCRAITNNKFKTDREKEVLRINSILRKNRTILKTLNPMGKATVRKEFMLLGGFDFRYFTHLYPSRKGDIYRFIYEYGYLHVADDKVLIVLWQDYMDTILDQSEGLKFKVY